MAAFRTSDSDAQPSFPVSTIDNFRLPLLRWLHLMWSAGPTIPSRCQSLVKASPVLLPQAKRMTADQSMLTLAAHTARWLCRTMPLPSRSFGPLCALGSSTASLLDVFGATRLLDCQPICSALDVECDDGGISPLYGELLPEAVALIQKRLKEGEVLFELGMGHGKVAFQLFLECDAVERVVGIELIGPRFERAEAAALRAAEKLAPFGDCGGFSLAIHRPGERSVITRHEAGNGRGHLAPPRTMDLRRGSFLDEATASGLETASFVIANFAIEPQSDTCAAMAAVIRRLRPGCRVLSLCDVAPLVVPSHRVVSTERWRLPTSWAPHTGHAFWLFTLG